MMSSNFEEWCRTTRFSKKYFFDSYVRYLKSLNLSTKPSESICGLKLRKIKTTPLMSRLNHTCIKESEHIDFLVINMGDIYMVAIHNLPYEYSTISNQGRSWTMTEFKQLPSFVLEQTNAERACKKIHWDEKTWLNVWSIPVHLKAVTNGDKDFRKEYEWGELVYEGNQYGDTSDFYIIGTLTRKNK